jgi:zinc D-Ala-D-Ala carboxypeptidase
VESGRSQTPVPSVTSRRELRERPVRATPRTPPKWLPRVAVLVALAVATIGVPVVEAASPESAVADAATIAGYPSAREVLSGSVLQSTPTSLLAAVPETQRVSEATSRSFDRNPLPGCDGQARVNASNGLIPESDLCQLWDPNHMLRGDAAVALAEMHEVFRVAFGRDLCITDSYRSLGAQRRVAALRGGLAATPGTSNHGWGLAIDLCGSESRSSAVLGWLFDNAPVYGWENPPWAQRGGSGPYEPWHWEYVPGTVEMGTDWSRD